MINFVSCSRDKYLEFGMKHILEPVITKHPQNVKDTLLFLVDEGMPLDSLLALRRRKDIETYSKVIILSDSLSWECIRRFIPGTTHFYIVRCSTAIISFLGQINALLEKERLNSSGYSKKLLTNKEKAVSLLFTAPLNVRKTSVMSFWQVKLKAIINNEQ